MSRPYYRIQDNRSALPARSENTWTDATEAMPGLSAFCNAAPAFADLLGGVADFTDCYAQNVRDAGGEAVLVVIQGTYVADDAGSAVTINPDLATERRLTAQQAWDLVLKAVSAKLPAWDWSDFRGDWEGLEDGVNEELGRGGLEDIINNMEI